MTQPAPFVIPKLTLVGMDYSPWTERARWALDLHRVPYRFSQHVPMVTMALLRLRLGDLRGRVTVPVLLGAREPVRDSLDIARYADHAGLGLRTAASSLFPGGPGGAADVEIVRWNELAETALRAGRALLVGRVAADPEALVEALPPFVPGVLRPLLRPVARMGIRYFRDKYQLDLAAVEKHESVVAEVLERLRKELGGRDHLLGQLSYADLVAATLLQMVAPVTTERAPHIRIGPATRRAWTTPRLAERFGDLVAWRDRLYARYRLPA